MKDTANQPLTPCEKLEILGRKHAVSHFEKGNFLDSPNEEVQKWLDRNHIMTNKQEFDQAYDAYCKGFQSYHVEKWIAGLTPEEAADLRSRLGSSSPVTVEVPVGKPGGPSATSRSLDRAGTDAPPLGRVANFPQTSSLRFQDDVPRTAWMDGDKENMALTCSPEGFLLNKERIPSLIAHLQAWLSTGSFSLTPPVSTQSHGDASLVAAHHSTPPSSEKPVVQPTGDEEDGCAVCGTLSAPVAGICQYCRNPYHVVMAADPQPTQSDSVILPISVVEEVEKGLRQISETGPYTGTRSGTQMGKIADSTLSRLRDALTKLNA